MIKAKETLDILKKGEYINRKGETIKIVTELDNCIRNSVLYKPIELKNLLEADVISNNEQNKTLIEVTNETTLEASRQLLNEGYREVTCLNFASAKSPGGGFLRGVKAQEESLARSSGLYPAIVQMKEMYQYNRKKFSALYSDYMIYSPKVPVFRHDEGELLDEIYCVSILTSPAVNVKNVKFFEPWNLKKVEDVMRNRIYKIFALAKARNQEALVLGAFGCGDFQNDERMVVKLFKEVLKDERFKNYFKKIVFAIYETSKEKPLLKTFQQILK